MKRTNLSDQILGAIAESKIPMTTISNATGLTLDKVTKIINGSDKDIYWIRKILRAVGYQLEITKIVKMREEQ